MGWRNSNNSLFAGSDTWNDDFWEERIELDNYDEGSDILDIDPYRWEVVEKAIWVLSEKKSCEESDFKKIEINWIEVEYKIMVELLIFNEATKQARSIWGRLPSEEEFNAIFEAIWIEEFTTIFPWVLYSDSEKTIWGKGSMIYFWLKEFSWTEVKVKVIFELDPENIHNCVIWKQYGICAMFIK